VYSSKSGVLIRCADWFDQTYVELPHLNVSELQHCISCPIQVALLFFGPHRPSVALTGSMTGYVSKSGKLKLNRYYLQPSTQYVVKGITLEQSCLSSGFRAKNSSVVISKIFAIVVQV
jgi:hypothetical protein